MNIIITGPKRCGKSTIIEKLLSEMAGSISGFLTEFRDRNSSDKELIIRSIDSSKSCKAVSWKDGIPSVDITAFDEFAPSLINTDSYIVIIDELGKFEKSCYKLRDAVERAFNGPCHVIAAIRLDADGWMQALKSRDDIHLFTVNGLNRNSVPNEIIELIENEKEPLCNE